MASPPSYSSNVFINCPFDDNYSGIMKAIVFAVFDCGFVPRCALEEDNGGDIRFDKIKRIIEECKFGIHDISRTELSTTTNLPRFNMPLELGVFIGAKRYGDPHQRKKNLLILDCERYRYQAFISDIAGHDIQCHNNNAQQAITLVRNWLNAASGRKTIPGGQRIQTRYAEFMEALPELAATLHLEVGEITHNDYTLIASEWLQEDST